MITVYHGTHTDKLDEILREGLRSPSMAYHSAKWFMVASDFESAAFHAHPDAPVVLELRVPSRKRPGRLQWPGYPHLWMPTTIHWGPRGGEKVDVLWFALREPIPAKYVRRVKFLTPDEYDRAHRL